MQIRTRARSTSPERKIFSAGTRVAFDPHAGTKGHFARPRAVDLCSASSRTREESDVDSDACPRWLTAVSWQAPRSPQARDGMMIKTPDFAPGRREERGRDRSEEHTSELQSP